MLDRKWFLGVALVSLCPRAWAQTPRPAMREGDTILGIGAIQQFDSVMVNDAKVWISLTDTTLTSSALDGVVLRNGFVTLREGDQVTLPAGCTLDEWNYIDLTSNTDLAQAVDFKPSGPKITGATWNFRTVVFGSTTTGTPGTPISSPVFPQPTTWKDVHFVKASDSSIFIMGEVLNPALSRQWENTLMRYDMDAQGNIVGNEVLMTEGMSLPPLGIIVRSTGLNQATAPPPASMDVNADGDFVCFVNGTTASLLALNLELELARVGSPSALPSRNWSVLSDSRTSINDHGDIVITGTITGNADSNWLMVKNGEKFVQTGDTLPLIGVLQAQTANDNDAPIFITNSGDVFWRAEDDDGARDAFVRNKTPFLRIGDTVDGLAVAKLESDAQCFGVSPNGRFFVGNIETVGQIDTLVFMDFGLILDIPGCHGNPGELEVASGDSRVGETLVMSMDNGMAAGDSASILFSANKLRPRSDCGVLTAAGEIIARRRNPLLVLALPPWDGVSPTTESVTIPADIALVDAVVFAQGTFRSSGNVRMTNGLRFEVGAP